LLIHILPTATTLVLPLISIQRIATNTIDIVNC
jgi:hypothetical protein